MLCWCVVGLGSILCSEPMVVQWWNTLCQGAVVHGLSQSHVFLFLMNYPKISRNENNLLSASLKLFFSFFFWQHFKIIPIQILLPIKICYACFKENKYTCSEFFWRLSLIFWNKWKVKTSLMFFDFFLISNIAKQNVRNDQLLSLIIWNNWKVKTSVMGFFFLH